MDVLGNRAWDEGASSTTTTTTTTTTLRNGEAGSGASTIWLLAALTAVSIGCVPTFDDRGSRVTAPRVLAMQAEPAEAAPGDSVTYRALIAGPTGEITSATIDWAFCTDRKPLTELAPISTRCMQPTAEWLVPIGNDLQASGTLPMDGCRLFGPTPPDPMPGEPAGRPVDPDSTGGYQQPLRLRLVGDDGEHYAALGTRITCGLAGATQEQTAFFTSHYHRNENPRIEGLVLRRANGEESTLAIDGGASLSVGEHLRLAVNWPACPAVDSCGDGVCGASETRSECAVDCMTPHGCGGAERYVLFDRATRENVEATERIRVAWFATGGTFAQERTESANEWDGPSTGGIVWLWVVLRDDRGGVAWGRFRLEVQ